MISGGRIFASILGQDRTAGLFFRKESLYPTELPGRFFTSESLAWSPRFVYCALFCFVFEPSPDVELSLDPGLLTIMSQSANPNVHLNF